jgi:hypothetical protein
MNVANIPDFKQVQPIRNYILIEVGSEFNNKVKIGEVDFDLDTSFEKEKHSVVNGRVITPPKSIYYNPKPEVQSIEYKVPLEVRQGDVIYFHYLAISNAEADGRLFKQDNKLYMFIMYDRVYCVERDNEVFGINGWLMVEPLPYERPKELEGIITPEMINNSDNIEAGIVKYTSTPVEQYKFEKIYGNEPDIVKKGDRIIFTPDSDIPIEYNLHQSIDSSKRYFRLQRKDVIAINNIK